MEVPMNDLLLARQLGQMTLEEIRDNLFAQGVTYEQLEPVLKKLEETLDSLEVSYGVALAASVGLVMLNLIGMAKKSQEQPKEEVEN